MASPKRKSYRIYFTFLFLAFGTLIAILTSAINYNLEIQDIDKQIAQNAEKEVHSKKALLLDYLRSMERYIGSLRNSTTLHRYIKSPTPENYDTLTSLFYSLASTNPAFTQVRYIDENGLETVRVDWVSGQSSPFIVDRANMQNKSHRYYYLESSQAQPNTFWYSKIDLNIENKKIEIPYKPVIRIASPVYVNQQYKGIVIINSHTKELLNRLRKSAFFEVSLIDKNGDFIVHHNDDYSWSKYLQTGYTIIDDQVDAAQLIQYISDESINKVNDVYISSVKSILVQDEAAILVYPKQFAISDIKQEQRKATLFIVALIAFISIPLALLLSRLPAKLNKKITEQNEKLTKYVTLIDENIMTSTSDANGTVLEVSTAYSRVVGYSKEELIGNKFSMLRHADEPLETYLNVWNIIGRGQVWEGELKHQKKDGTPYWLQTVIHPAFTKIGDPIYTAIHNDISDKKQLEEISVTDELTGLHNRRFFKKTMDRELKRAQREEKQLTFAILDVDHFKQYNDHYGHQKGDLVLSNIGRCLKKLLGRGSDFSFRLGGEEFGVLFNDLDKNESIAFGEQIRQSIQNLEIEHLWSKSASTITVSMGLLVITPGPGISVDEIYKLADKALYEAKALGRNRVVPKTLESKV